MRYQLLKDCQFQLDPRIKLTSAAQEFYNYGFVSSASNFSARLPDNGFWITACNQSKEELLPIDFVRVYPDGKTYTKYPDILSPPDVEIHQTIYELFPGAQACYQINIADINLAFSLTQTDSLSLSNFKGTLYGIFEVDMNYTLPIFDNHLYASQIALNIKRRFQAELPLLPALLIRGNSLILWATSLENTYRYIEFITSVLYMVKNLQKCNQILTLNSCR